ncbi:MAG TPA: hypothetical protein VHN99_06830 [Deinococcales bacterium]|nr:hypothetical protein [Deinococcales bacterium]
MNQDTTIPGGAYQNDDGSFVDANGRPIPDERLIAAGLKKAPKPAPKDPKDPKDQEPAK